MQSQEWGAWHTCQCGEQLLLQVLPCELLSQLPLLIDSEHSLSQRVLFPGLDGHMDYRLNGGQHGAHQGCGSFLHCQALLPADAVWRPVWPESVKLQRLQQSPDYQPV